MSHQESRGMSFIDKILKTPGMTKLTLHAHYLKLKSAHEWAEKDAVLFITTKSDIDDDGMDDSKITDKWASDTAHQGQTSYDPDGTIIDALKVPYVVLPLHMAPSLKIPLGTLATVLIGEKVFHGIYADEGGDDLDEDGNRVSSEIGEMSIRLAEGLGYTRLKDGAIINDGIDEIVYWLYYRGKTLPNTATCEEIQAAGEQAFEEFLSPGEIKTATLE